MRTTCHCRMIGSPFTSRIDQAARLHFHVDRVRGQEGDAKPRHHRLFHRLVAADLHADARSDAGVRRRTAPSACACRCPVRAPGKSRRPAPPAALRGDRPGDVRAGATTTCGWSPMTEEATSISSGGRPITARSRSCSRRPRITSARLPTISRSSMRGCACANAASTRGAKYLAVLTTPTCTVPVSDPARAASEAALSRQDGLDPTHSVGEQASGMGRHHDPRRFARPAASPIWSDSSCICKRDGRRGDIQRLCRAGDGAGARHRGEDAQLLQGDVLHIQFS